MPPPALILDRVFDHEIERRAQVLLTQPIGGGGVIDIPWGEAVDQARRMAAHLQGLGLAPGSLIAILSPGADGGALRRFAIAAARLRSNLMGDELPQPPGRLEVRSRRPRACSREGRVNSQ